MKRVIIVEQNGIVDDQSGPGPPFFAITKNEGQGPLSPHHVKESTPRGKFNLDTTIPESAQQKSEANQLSHRGASA